MRRARVAAMSMTFCASLRVRAVLLAAFAFATTAAVAHAASEAAGTAAASFLSVGSGASVLSMGGATLASGNDLAAGAWNPASLARMDALQFALTHAPLPGGATQDWVAAGGRMRGEWRWSAQALFHREAGIEGRDASNNPTGDVSASDVGVGAHLARRFGGRVDVGLGAEWVHEALDGASGSGVAFSGGVRTEAGPLGFALAARHIGGSMNYGSARYDLPGVIAAGVSYEDPTRGLRVAADLESPTHYYRSLRLGGEWLWRGQFALRAGYRSELGNTDAARLSGPTFGMGTGAGSVWMDYAFMPGGEVGAGEHRLGITFRPGGMSRGPSDGGMRMTGTASPPPQPRPTTPPRASAPASSENRAKPAPAAVPTASSSAKSETESTPVPPIVKSPAAEAAASATVPVPAKPKPVADPNSPETLGTKPVPVASAPAPAVPVPAASKPVPATQVPAASTAPAVAPVKTGPVVEAPGKPAPVAAPAAPPARPSSVVVAEGETLASIARRWGTTVPALMMANNLVNEKVTPGKKLKLPLPVKQGAQKIRVTM